MVESVVKEEAEGNEREEESFDVLALLRALTVFCIEKKLVRTQEYKRVLM